MSVKLRRVSYTERFMQPKQWRLEELTLWDINLLVGRNGTGKSRTLNLIWNLARFFAPEGGFRVANCGYDVSFDDEAEGFRYVLSIEKGKVTNEEFYVGGDRKLWRGAGGAGEIFAAAEGRMIRFKPPENELAASSRRDSIQHPFLDGIHIWAEGVRHYTFGTHLGKNSFVIPIQGGPEPDERDCDQVVAIFRKGQNTLGRAFVDSVKRDMIALGYPIEGIDTAPPENVRVITGGGPREVFAMAVREEGIDALVDQTEMSQGMFRALSILIQVNYSQMANRAHCIIIDDIGEGLDFERSTKLIEILRGKAKQSSFQLIMSTNDQFVMNHVPLEEWSVLSRDGRTIHVHNHENSREVFEEFKFIGLNNFSFFEMNFAEGAPKEEAVRS